jgi:hypothetical protein
MKRIHNAESYAQSGSREAFGVAVYSVLDSKGISSTDLNSADGKLCLTNDELDLEIVYDETSSRVEVYGEEREEAEHWAAEIAQKIDQLNF